MIGRRYLEEDRLPDLGNRQTGPSQFQFAEPVLPQVRARFVTPQINLSQF